MIDLGGDVTDNGISKLVFTILSAVAEAERDRIRERISTVKADQKARGSYLGGKVPYGYELVGEGKDKRLAPVAEQQEVIASILAMRAEGKPLRAIQTALSDRLSLEAINRICRDVLGAHMEAARNHAVKERRAGRNSVAGYEAAMDLETFRREAGGAASLQANDGGRDDS
jgi:DNA invertase Pin-like site-specific DNA recombinase